MRRGWHEDWDTTDRVVWTVVAIGWLCLFGWWLIWYVLMRTGIGPSGLNGLVPQWTWETLILTHGFAFAAMWLRRMFTSRNRDR